MTDDDGMQRSTDELPRVPDRLSGRPVAAWREPIELVTYEPDEPSAYPSFLNSRVYQGSSGAVYPLPFHERVSAVGTPRTWNALHIENEWVRVTVLPELGGRIHAAYDKVRDYDIFYRPTAIKPALVGLAGPWVSGGVEFNWPQHHRPATFLPMASHIEEHPDGSATLWCADHDPFARMASVHGVRLRPDSSAIELVVRLHNRTDLAQTFLWWANVCVAVHDGYQSFFPPDVHYVADHANRATVAFPAANGPYYGVDYPARRSPDHPDADRLDWYRNIPVPTSYMVLETAYPFFGGYDHVAGAGFVHHADPGIAPGKKQWTWGNAEFGQAWDRQLSDDGRPYIELMAGVFTNNQPDFSFLAPGETKAFTQVWFPYGDIGTVQAATDRLAAHISREDEGVRVGLATASAEMEVTAVLLVDGRGHRRWEVRLSPEQPWTTTEPAPDGDVRLVVMANGEPLLEAAPAAPAPDEAVPPPATEPASPADVGSVDELVLIGVHLDQYRHATRSPEDYWREALRRDPGNLRANTLLGLRRYREARYEEALPMLSTAVARSSMLNTNPRDGEPHYTLGLCLARLGRVDEARRVLAKAAWDGHWAAPAYEALARLEARQGDRAEAVRHAEEAHRVAGDDPRAQAALATLVRDRDPDRAQSLAEDLLVRNPLDPWALDLLGREASHDAHTLMDLGLEYAALGYDGDALRVLGEAVRGSVVMGETNVLPLVAYHRACLMQRTGGDPGPALREARAVDSRHCLAVTADDVETLTWAAEAAADDPLPPALLGSWCYHHGDAAAAEGWWRTARTRASDPVVERNLALVAMNHHADPAAAADHYREARRLAPDDARLVYESLQLDERRGVAAADRLATCRAEPELVAARDDSTLYLARLLTETGAPEDALSVLAGRRFQPWEGGEGQILAAWEYASLAAASLAPPERAEELVRAALQPPQSLGEARHPLASAVHLWLGLGDALARAERCEAATAAWRTAMNADGEDTSMAPVGASELTFFTALAARRLGDTEAEQRHVMELAAFRDSLAAEAPTVDYFATSLPRMLLFADDPVGERDRRVALLDAQLRLLSGREAGVSTSDLLTPALVEVLQASVRAASVRPRAQ